MWLRYSHDSIPHFGLYSSNWEPRSGSKCILTLCFLRALDSFRDSGCVWLPADYKDNDFPPCSHISSWILKCCSHLQHKVWIKHFLHWICPGSSFKLFKFYYYYFLIIEMGVWKSSVFWATRYSNNWDTASQQIGSSHTPRSSLSFRLLLIIPLQALKFPNHTPQVIIPPRIPRHVALILREDLSYYCLLFRKHTKGTWPRTVWPPLLQPT